VPHSPGGSDSITRQIIQESKPQISRVRPTRRISFAAEQEMLGAAPVALHQGVPPSSDWWWPGDENLAKKTRTEPMKWQGVPRHRVTERNLARGDTKEGVHKRRKVHEWPRGRVSQMSEVTRPLARQHLTDLQKHRQTAKSTAGETHAPSPAWNPQARREAKRRRSSKCWIEEQGGSHHACACVVRPLGWAPHLHAILKDGASDIVSDYNFAAALQQEALARVSKSGKLPIPSDMQRQHACSTSRMRSAICLSNELGPPL
jgi:hypothetical protein